MTIILICITVSRMYVCICKNVREADIHDAVSNGVSSFKELQRETGLGTNCGECKSQGRTCMRKAKATAICDTLIPISDLSNSAI